MIITTSVADVLAADHCCANAPLIVTLAVLINSKAFQFRAFPPPISSGLFNAVATLLLASPIAILFSARAARRDHFPRTASHLEVSCTMQFQCSAARHNAIQYESTASLHPAFPWRRLSDLFTAIANPCSATADPRVSIQSNARAYLNISEARPLRPMQFPIKSFLCASCANQGLSNAHACFAKLSHIISVLRFACAPRGYACYAVAGQPISRDASKLPPITIPLESSSWYMNRPLPLLRHWPKPRSMP